MAETAAIDAIPLGVLFLIALVAILAAVEIGYRIGWWRSRSNPEKEGLVGGMVATELGLLAFLLAFTFGIAASRYDDRRRALLDETNAIGTAYLRAAMLPDARATKVKQLLRDYVDLRIQMKNTSDLTVPLRKSVELQDLLWTEAVASSQQDPRSIPVGLFVESLNEVIDLHTKRVQAGLRSRIPATVWIALSVVTALSFCVMGYHGGLTRTQRSPAILAVALTFAAVIWLVADLDSPRDGLIQVSQQPIHDLRASMDPKPG